VRERATDRAALGKETFVGVCAKCHGLAAQGDIGPNIASSPLLANEEALADIVHHGTGKMPAVGNDWSNEQTEAMVRYLERRFHPGGSSGG
jgi:mono/diheme cytochrome c family protein